MKKVKMKLAKMAPSLALLFSLSLIAQQDLAGAAEKNPQSVQVTIRSILAENKNDEFDAKLKGSNEAASGLTMLAMTQPFEIVSPGRSRRHCPCRFG